MSKLGKTIQFHVINTLRQTLSEILQKGYHADHMIDKYIRANPKWSPEERKFFVSTIYRILRHKTLLSYLVSSDDLLQIIGADLLKNGFLLPARPEYANLKSEQIRQKMSEEKSSAVEFSIPDWLDEIGRNDFQERWHSIAHSLTEEPSLYIRANGIKTTKKTLLMNLKKEGFQVVDLEKHSLKVADALDVKDKKNVFMSASYRSGDFEVQDIGSQYISTLMQLAPEVCVIDACAGSGGKSLHMASLMQNRGQIISMDIKPQKLKDLKTRADKAGAKIISTRLIDKPQVIASYKETADRLLLDVPCSGLGVLKRNPDTKWKMTPEQIDDLISIQRKILTEYTSMCKSGGLAVYATCSILKRENEDQIKWFLQQKVGQSWKLVSESRVWPDQHQSDGFYAAVLKKN